MTSDPGRVMGAVQTSEAGWTACPQCLAANASTSSACTVCRASLRAGQSTPLSRWRGALVWVIVILAVSAMVGALVLAVTDARSPESVQSAMRLRYCYSFAWMIGALRAVWSGWWMFRARRPAMGMVLTMVALLLALIAVGTLAPPRPDSHYGD